MTDYKRSIVVEIDGTGAVVGARKVQASLNDIDRATKNVDGGMRRVGDASRSATSSMHGLGTAAKAAISYLAASALSGAVKETALLAARYETLGVVMGVVGNNAGYTRAEMDKFEAGLRKTGITAIESRNNLSAMASANMDLSKASQLARMAQDAAVVGNVNSSEAFKQMIYGIKSAQVEVLRTIGINVNFENSYKKMSEQLGKNAVDLNENEKMQARLNAVLAQAPSIAGVYEESLTTVGKKLASTSRYSEDARVKLGAIFQPALVLLVDTYTDALKGVNAELDNTEVIQKWARVIKSEVLDIMQIGAALNMVLAKAGQSAAIVGMGIYGPGSALGIENSEKGFEHFAGAYLDYQKQFADSEVYLNKLIGEQERLTSSISTQTGSNLAERERIAAGNARRAEEAVNSLAGGVTDAEKKAAAKRAAAALAGVQEEIARLTLSAADFEHYQIDQEFAKIAKEIGAANPLLAQWVDLRRKEAELTRSKSVDKELTDFFGDIDKQSADLLKKAEDTRQKNEEILLDFSDRYREIVVGETEFKKEQIDRQAEIFRKAGADEVAVAQWVAQEKLAVSRDWQDGATRALQSYADEAGNAAQNVEDVMTMIFQGIEDAVVEFVKTGKLEFADLVTSINAEIARLAFRGMASEAYDWMGGLLKTGLSLAGSDFGSGSSVAAGSAGGGFNYAGEMSSFFATHHAGGIAGLEPTSMRAVNPAIFAGADRFHAGGIAGDEVPAILKRGEGVFTEGQMKALGGSDSETKALLREIASGIKAQRGTKVVNAIGKGAIANELSGPEGEQVIFNHIRRNPSAVRRMLGV